MGDYANVNLVLSETDNTLSLYTHWGGSTYASDVAAALEASRSRWDDESYFCRIFIDQFFKNIRDATTGGGILVGDNRFESEHPRLTVDLTKRLVFIGKQDYDPGLEHLDGRAIPFEEFITDTDLHDELQG